MLVLGGILMVLQFLDAAHAATSTTGGRVTSVQWLQDVFQLLQKASADGMKQCSLLLLYDDDAGQSITSTPALQPFFPFGVASADFRDMTISEALAFVEKSSMGGSCTGLLMVTSSETWQALLDASSGASESEEMWSGYRRTLVLLRPTEGGATARAMLNSHQLRKSQHVVVGEQKGHLWSLYGTVLCRGNHRQSSELLATYSAATGFSGASSLFGTGNMADLQGFTFTIAALPYSPFIMEDHSGDGDKYTGLEVMLIEMLSDHANFSYSYKAPSDGEWGRRHANGTWTGMIGLVDREEADWAVSDITFSPGRARHVDFSIAFVYDASELLTPRALQLPKYLGPVKPFTLSVWLIIAIFIALSGPLLSLIARASVNPDKQDWFNHPGNAAIYTLLPVFMHGNNIDVLSHSTRMFAIFWLLAAMTISIVYSSSLTSFLILPGYIAPIMDLEQLVSSDIGWGKVNFGGVQNAMLEQTRDPVLVKLREGVQWRTSLDAILEDVVAGTLATWDNRITTRLKIAVYFTDSGGQPLVTLTGFELLQERIAWPMIRNSPVKRRFDELMRRARQGGLVNKWLRDVILQQQALGKSEKREPPEGNSGEAVVLSLDHFQGAFFVLAIGYSAGGLIILFELLFFRFTKKTELQ